LRGASIEKKNIVLGQEVSLPLCKIKGTSRLAHVKGYAVFRIAVHWLVHQVTNNLHQPSLVLLAQIFYGGGTKNYTWPHE